MSQTVLAQSLVEEMNSEEAACYMAIRDLVGRSPDPHNRFIGFPVDVEAHDDVLTVTLVPAEQWSVFRTIPCPEERPEFPATFDGKPVRYRSVQPRIAARIPTSIREIAIQFASEFCGAIGRDPNNHENVGLVGVVCLGDKGNEETSLKVILTPDSAWEQSRKPLPKPTEITDFPSEFMGLRVTYFEKFLSQPLSTKAAP